MQYYSYFEYVLKVPKLGFLCEPRMLYLRLLITCDRCANIRCMYQKIWHVFLPFTVIYILWLFSVNFFLFQAEALPDLDDLLQCPVCYEIPSGQIFQCNEGHHVCGRCKARLSQCPVCRALFFGTRNYAMEELIANVRKLRAFVSIQFCFRRNPVDGWSHNILLRALNYEIFCHFFLVFIWQ